MGHMVVNLDDTMCDITLISWSYHPVADLEGFLGFELKLPWKFKENFLKA